MRGILINSSDQTVIETDVPEDGATYDTLDAYFVYAVSHLGFANGDVLIVNSYEGRHYRVDEAKTFFSFNLGLV